jgi:CAAX protease family protein
MRQYLQGLSPATEFAIAILGAFGLVFITTFLTLATKTGAAEPVSTGWYTNAHLVSILVYEVPVGAAVFAFLRVRGWSLERLGFRLTASETLVGFGLALLNALVFFAVLHVFFALVPPDLAKTAVAQATPAGFGLMIVILVSIINPLFEETFVCGYVVTVLKERADVPTAVTISTAIRLLYHLYQGPFAFLSIVPFGVVLAWWYARYGRLWPVVVAHGLQDFISLVGYAG